MKFVCLSHADSSMIGRDISGFTDITGQNVFHKISAALENDTAAFLSFWYHRLNRKLPSEKLSYMIKYKPWNIYIGSGVYVDDIRTDENIRLTAVVNELNQSIEKIIIANTGYFFLFDKNYSLIVHPVNTKKKKSGFTYPLKELSELAVNNKTTSNINIFKFQKNGQLYFVSYFKPLEWFIVCVLPESELSAPAKSIIFDQTIITALITSAGIIILFFAIRSMTKPLMNLESSAIKISNDNFINLDIAAKNIKHIALSSTDEISSLASAFASMIFSLKNHIKKLTETTAAKERIESELIFAAEIQKSMLPQPPEFISDTFSIYAALKPARNIGGDLYDFFPLTEKYFCCVIGDVSDKGAPAALFMSRSKTVIRLFCQTFSDKSSPSYFLPEIMNKINAELITGNSLFMFITLFIGIFESETSEFHYVSAGHNPPVFFPNGSAPYFLDKPKGPALGIKKNPVFEEKKILLKRGDRIVCFTDGVTEAVNISGILFSEERLIKTLNSMTYDSPKQIILNLMNALTSFSIGIEQADDIALLVFYKNTD